MTRETNLVYLRIILERRWVQIFLQVNQNILIYLNISMNNSCYAKQSSFLDHFSLSSHRPIVLCHPITSASTCTLSDANTSVHIGTAIYSVSQYLLQRGFLTDSHSFQSADFIKHIKRNQFSSEVSLQLILCGEFHFIHIPTIRFGI